MWDSLKNRFASADNYLTSKGIFKPANRRPSASMTGKNQSTSTDIPSSKPATAAPVATSKATPAKISSSSKPGIVSKADLETYRKNVGNRNATLGQYMNDLQNKTAIKGGKNDPSVIQKTMKSGEKAFDPTTTTGQYGGPKSTGSTSAPKPAVTPAPAAEKPTTTAAASPATTPQNPDQERTKVKAPLPSMAQSGAGSSNDSAAVAAGNEKMKAMSSMKPEPAPKKDAGTTPSKTFAESVEVGDYKYRII